MNGTRLEANHLPEDIRVDEQIYVWIDILGFSDEVERPENYVRLARSLKNFQTQFLRESDFNCTIISDGIVLEFKPTSPSSLVDSFRNIGRLQLEFILNEKYFVRGGIATGTRLNAGNPSSESSGFKGDVFQYVSNGLSRAVKLEEKGVTWPVIATDDRYLKSLKKIFKIENDSETFGLKKSHSASGSAIYFIDFLNGDSAGFSSVLQKKVVEFSKPETYAVFNKYQWLARYYQLKNPEEGTQFCEILEGADV